MNFELFKMYARGYQKSMKQLSKIFDWSPPLLLQGEGILKILPNTLKGKNYKKVLIITDEGIRNAGLLDSLLEGLQSKNIEYFIYDKTVPNPTDENIIETADLYNKNRCDAIIGFGGGSPLDCAKGTAAVIGTGSKNIKKYQGLMKIRKKLPPVIAVPTTAGTGSEGTIATVITDSENQMKYAVSDMVLLPEAAVLDASLTTGLPPKITAHTGMDALSHVVESYTNLSNTSETRNMSEKAVELIFQNLKKAYHDGEDITARNNMQYAAYLAGRAFTRAYVGNIHAMAHQIGAKYPMTHGEANAVIMPHIMEEYGEAVYEDLAKLADCAGVSNTGEANEVKARKFIQNIRDLNQELGIGQNIPEIEETDLDEMIEYSFDEANPAYPVPVIFSREKLREMYLKVKNG